MHLLTIALSLLPLASYAAPTPGGPVEVPVGSLKPGDLEPFNLTARNIGPNGVQLYITGFKAYYTGSSTNIPADALKEVSGLSQDINKGFGGDYVYLQPTWTSGTSIPSGWGPDFGSLCDIHAQKNTCAYFDLSRPFVFSRKSNEPGMTGDLGNGAHSIVGDCRWLSWDSSDSVSGLSGCSVKKGIYEAALWRTKTDMRDVTLQGWNGPKSSDINKGRGGDYLYVVTKQ